MGIKFCRYPDEAPVDYEPYKEGWLNNASSFIEGTLAKYVVLSRNPCAIMAYKSDSKRPQDTICYFCLQDVEFSYDPSSLLLKFRRKRGGKERWTFLAKNEKELKEWALCIEEVMDKSKSSVIKTNWSLDSQGGEGKRNPSLENKVIEQ